ncbi:hypothetical protein K1719_032572 [Acacia pycnantha]|nr:hypothetical protein K1719_032572 [Acacia pycnantha]
MLPYYSLPEAQAALGRNLTFAETLWFNYFATKSDYFLYCHNILFLFLIFSIFPFPMIFLEVKRFGGLDKYKIQPKMIGVRRGLPLPSGWEIFAQLVYVLRESLSSPVLASCCKALLEAFLCF